MNIQTKTGSEPVSGRAVDLLEGKLRKLAKLVRDDEQEAQFSVAYARESGSNSSESLWRVSIQLTRAGMPDVHASETAATAEAAGDKAYTELKTELRRHHGKRHSLIKRGGQLLKRLGRGW